MILNYNKLLDIKMIIWYFYRSVSDRCLLLVCGNDVRVRLLEIHKTYLKQFTLQNCLYFLQRLTVPVVENIKLWDNSSQSQQKVYPKWKRCHEQPKRILSTKEEKIRFWNLCSEERVRTHLEGNGKRSAYSQVGITRLQIYLYLQV